MRLLLPEFISGISGSVSRLSFPAYIMLISFRSLIRRVLIAQKLRAHTELRNGNVPHLEK